MHCILFIKLPLEWKTVNERKLNKIIEDKTVPLIIKDIKYILKLSDVQYSSWMNIKLQSLKPFIILYLRWLVLTDHTSSNFE